VQVEANHRPVRRLRSIEIAAFPRRRSRSGTASTTPDTCNWSRNIFGGLATGKTFAASTAARAATSPTRCTPSSAGARDRSRDSKRRPAPARPQEVRTTPDLLRADAPRQVPVCGNVSAERMV
jgi:hypothetical protein